jgi:CcmD family protein
MEQFLHDNSLYVVLGIALILWFGIGFYILSIDKRIGKIERQIEQTSTNDNDS